MLARPAPGGVLPAAVAQWKKFLELARRQRLEADVFESHVSILSSKFRLPPMFIAELVLAPPRPDSYMLDNRIPQYLDVLLKLRLLDTPSVLRVLYKYSTLHKHAPPTAAATASNSTESDKAKAGANGHTGKSQGENARRRWGGSYSSDELVFFRLHRFISKGPGIRSGREAVDVVRIVARWMTLFADVAAAFSRDAFGGLVSLQTKNEVDLTRQAFSLLVVAMCENQLVVNTLGKPGAKVARKELSRSLESFIPSTMQTAPPGIVACLEQFRSMTLASIEPADKKDATAEIPSYMDMIGLDNVQIPEIPIVNSRAGLYIYVGAALVGRPLLDDSALFGYLNNKYQGDIQTTAIQLILASFDILANAVFRNEGPNTWNLLKSHVANKLPMILGSLAASSSPMYPFDAEFCITQALSQVDTTVFPTLSGLFDMHSNSSFQDSVRQDFCFACQLHGLLSQTTRETLLGEITYQNLPAGGRYIKETLVQACLEDTERAQKLIGELDSMDGNVGAAAQAIVEVMVNLCRNKETMTLKQLCRQLASKPLSLDILLLFNSAQKVLHPLCEVLDNWGGYDEDQGEYQPVYEEFGSILLLLLAFVYRYGLIPADLGIQSADSFVGRLITRGHLPRPIDELNEQENLHFGGWVRGLFDADAGGLGDELMSSCPPQSFFLLMPTLFEQMVLALNSVRLNEELLKGGLEYLVDVLLLPSLVPALLYLSDLLWTHRADGPQGQRAIITILQLILRPSSMSTEGATMMSSVLYIVAKPLDHALRCYQRQDPKTQEVEPLLKALKEFLPLSRRTGAADHKELESWTGSHGPSNGTPTMGLSASIRHTIQSLIQWAQNPPLNGVPTPYTHRQMLVALKLLGAKRVLGILLEELKAHNESDTAAVAYDVATALVCAPDVSTEVLVAAASFSATPHGEPQQRRTSLRVALKAEADDWKRIQKTDAPMAETVVRLYRRVEAQMVPPPEPPQMLQADDLGVLGASDMALGNAMAAVVVADANMDSMSLDTTGLDGTGMDLSMGGGDLGGLASATGSTGGLDLNNDDIFGNLGADFGTDFGGWDTMELI